MVKPQWEIDDDIDGMREWETLQGVKPSMHHVLTGHVCTPGFQTDKKVWGMSNVSGTRKHNIQDRVHMVSSPPPTPTHTEDIKTTIVANDSH